MALRHIIAELRAATCREKGRQALREEYSAEVYAQAQEFVQTDEEVWEEVQTQFNEEEASRKRHRYQREESSLQQVRQDLESGDREEWLQATLETERILG